MADDITPPGFSVPVATEEIGGRHFQITAPCNAGLDEAAISVGTTATKLGTGTSGAPLASRRFLYLTNNGSVAVTLGGSGVVAGSGPVLEPGGTAQFPLGPDVDLYGRVASGTCDVGVLELA